MDRIILEVITPPHTWAPQKVQEWANRVCKILTKHGLSYLNIPEVVSETRNGERNVRFIAKMDNLEFSKVLSAESANAVPMLNKISVIIKSDIFEQWVADAYKQGIRHLVLVGGELPNFPYPGYPVTEAASWIKQNYPDMKLGGITIFTRPHEADRIHSKMQAGIDFFISQIIYEVTNLKQVIIELERLTGNEGLPDIYVSLAPASRIRDIEFMQWLGVEIPSAVLAYLARDEERVEERTLEINRRVQEEILEFIEKKRYRLGFNVEHVIYNNLWLSEKMVEELRERMGR